MILSFRLQSALVAVEMVSDQLPYRKIVGQPPTRISDPQAKTSEKVLQLTAHCDSPGLMIARSDDIGDLSVLTIPRHAF